MEREELEVDVQLKVSQALVKKRRLFYDVFVNSHQHGVGVDGLMDRFRFCGLEGPLVVFATFYNKVD